MCSRDRNSYNGFREGALVCHASRWDRTPPPRPVNSLLSQMSGLLVRGGPTTVGGERAGLSTFKSPTEVHVHVHVITCEFHKNSFAKEGRVEGKLSTERSGVPERSEEIRFLPESALSVQSGTPNQVIWRCGVCVPVITTRTADSSREHWPAILHGGAELLPLDGAHGRATKMSGLRVRGGPTSVGAERAGLSTFKSPTER